MDSKCVLAHAPTHVQSLDNVPPTLNACMDDLFKPEGDSVTASDGEIINLMTGKRFC